MKDERILKQIGKLLEKYGVESEEQRNAFLTDVKNLKEEDEQDIPKNQQPTDEPADNPQDKPVENADNPAEEKPEGDKSVDGDKPQDEPKGDEPVKEEVADDSKKPNEVPPVDNPVNDQQSDPVQANDENMILKGQVDELKKVNDTLNGRVSKLEELITKLGVEQQSDETVGVSPTATPKVDGGNDAFNAIMNKRIG